MSETTTGVTNYEKVPLQSAQGLETPSDAKDEVRKVLRRGAANNCRLTHPDHHHLCQRLVSFLIAKTLTYLDPFLK